jgi:hypothetical protein
MDQLLQIEPRTPIRPNHHVRTDTPRYRNVPVWVGNLNVGGILGRDYPQLSPSPLDKQSRDVPRLTSHLPNCQRAQHLQ